MADFLIRDLDDETKRRLQDAAMAHGRSLSDEAKIVLRRALSVRTEEVGLGTKLRTILGRYGDIELEIPSRELPEEPPSFG